MLRWAIRNELAGSHRPGYPSEHPIGSDIDRWIEDIKALGIKSIICFLAEDQLCFYSELQGGLISYYRELGFAVAHVPARDYQTPPLTDKDLARALEAFRTLPKPVLVHCSAGLDRTGLALEYIQRQMKV